MTLETAHLGKLYIHATNIHQGGGKSLLWSIIDALPSSVSAVLVLDSRMPLPNGIPESVQIKKVMPSILQRVRAERWLAENVHSQDIVLCFGNLPPLFKLRGRTVVFVQNRYLIDDVKLDKLPLKVRLRISIERLWLAKKIANASEFVVQTPTMKKLLEIKTRGMKSVRILPFMEKSSCYVRSLVQTKEQKHDFDFVYVASGEPHKNHHRLVEAWCLLAEEGLFPSLVITLDEQCFTSLCDSIDEMRKKYHLNIVNMGCLSHNDILDLYKKAGALIYPSSFESFGLPLIEARQANLSILAAELDYVRDLLDPEQTFNPDSSISISRAVKRFIGSLEPVYPILNASGFLKQVFNEQDSQQLKKQRVFE